MISDVLPVNDAAPPTRHPRVVDGPDDGVVDRDERDRHGNDAGNENEIEIGNESVTCDGAGENDDVGERVVKRTTLC